MAKEKEARDERKVPAAYYRLKTRSVSDLVDATPENSPEVSAKELRKYRKRRFMYLGDGIKFFLVKGWFAGVACWFLLIGLSTFGIANLDMMLILGLGVGLLWDLPVNIFIRLREEKPGELSRFMMFPGKGVGAGVLNALYGIVLVYLVAQTYGALNALMGAGEEDALTVGPILFGLFTAGWDLLLLQVKKVFRRMLSDAKKKTAGERRT